VDERLATLLNIYTVSTLLHLAETLQKLRLYTVRQVIMAALWNRAGHYIFALWFLSSSSSFFLSFFFPRLISAVGDWMSTILPHMVWP